MMRMPIDSSHCIFEPRGRHVFRMTFGLLLLCMLCLFQSNSAGYLWSDEATAENSRATDEQVSQLAATIDRHIQAAWKDKAVVPAARCDDAEFARRAYLDLIGRIPRVAEIRRFLADTSGDKREQLVNELLQRPAHAVHFATVLRSTLMPPTRENPRLYHLGTALEEWLRPRIQRGDGYDRIVNELLTVPLTEQTATGALAENVSEHFGAVAWYQIHDLKPENMASAASRLLLGVRLECAQCHDHPFDHWSQDQFWQTAAFFSRMDLKPGKPSDETIRPVDIRVPNQERAVEARFLDKTSPVWSKSSDPRSELAAWMTSPANPFFARSTANRIWATLTGRGIVHPVDDFRNDNPATHPELLDQLAQSLITEKFDLKFLLRAIMKSDMYQRSSSVTNPSQDNPVYFARMVERPLTAEQLWDSLATATGYLDPVPLAHRGLSGLPAESPRGQFVVAFLGESQPDSPQISILHSLKFLHGDFVGKMTDAQTGNLLLAVSEAPYLTDAERIETLYLAAFARLPTEQERQVLTKYLVDPLRQADLRRSWGDVFWALLNSSEFLLNH